MNKLIFTLIALALANTFWAQRTPAPTQQKSIYLKNATLHTGKLEVLENAILGFENGKITYIGTSPSAIPHNAEVIDADGQHVYPGFIAANTTLGLLEIGAVKASDDKEELGQNNANARAIIAYNAESKLVETSRPNGVLLAQIAPQGGRFSGTSSIVQLDAWNWEDAVVKIDEGIHLHWPQFRGDSNNKSYQKKKEKHYESIQEIENYLAQAKHYSPAENEANLLRVSALKDLFNGQKTLYVDVNGAKDILQVLALKRKLEIPNLVIVGGYEAHLVTDELLKENVGVIARRIHELPQFADDDIYHSPRTAAKLIQSGVKVALDVQGDMPEIAVRNIPFYAGSLCAFGITPEQALQTLTLFPAEIFGIDDNYGSLEVGKSATLFVSTGNALDMKENNLTYAFIDGREIDLNTFQKELYEKFSEKYQLAQEK